MNSVRRSSGSILNIGVLCIIIFFGLFKQANCCGGFLQANEGILRYSDQTTSDKTCIWFLQLLTKESFVIQLEAIEGLDTSIGLFTEDQVPDSSAPIVQPKYIFNSSSQNSTINIHGRVLLLVLKRSSANLDTSRAFTLSWRVSNESNWRNYSDTIVNYVGSTNGQLTTSSDDSELTVIAINPPLQRWNLDVEIKILDHEETCSELTYSIFEVSSAGNLREIARTCGRPLSLHNLRSPLIAVIVTTKIQDHISEMVYLKWTSRQIPASTSTQMTISTTEVTDELSSTSDSDFSTTRPTGGEWIISEDECGGTLIGKGGIINYKLNTSYEVQELCIWTIRISSTSASDSPDVIFQLIADGLEECCDYIQIGTVVNSKIHNNMTLKGGDRKVYTVTGPVVFVTFRSDPSTTGLGFQFQFERVESKKDDDTDDNGLLEFPQTLTNEIKYTHINFQPNVTAIDYKLSYPQDEIDTYNPNELVTIVINPLFTTISDESIMEITLNLEYTDIEQSPECISDVLNIHGINNFGGIEHSRSVCMQDFNEFITFTSPRGFVLLFQTNDQVQLSGFDISFSYEIK